MKTTKTKKTIKKSNYPKKWKIVPGLKRVRGIEVYEANGSKTFTYAHILYEITEQRYISPTKGEIRTRHVYSQSLYLHEHPKHWLAFKVAASAINELTNAILAMEKV